MSTRHFIPNNKQSLDEYDIQSVVKVLRSSLITQGPAVAEFEQSLAEYAFARYAIAVSSGTAGLHLACLSLGVVKGDIVWTSPITFAASAACALYCGADVDFVDIDPDTRNISMVSLEEKLAEAEGLQCLPKVLVVVHFAGNPCDMKTVKMLSDRYGFKVIEDACHALGARYDARSDSTKVGCCQYSDATVFSFHPVKSMTTGEGGMIMTNDQSIADQCRKLRHHGIEYQPEKLVNENDREGYHEVQAIGFNYRLSDIHAALGSSQLKKLNHFIAKRKLIAERYLDELGNLPIKLPQREELEKSAWHLFVVELNDPAKRDELFNKLRSEGIGVSLHYIPVYRHPSYNQYISSYDMFPYAEKYYASCLSLPIYSAMTFDDVDRVAKALASELSS